MLSVLIVDDERPVCRALKQMIHEVDTQVQVIGEAYNGKEAIAFMKQVTPDVIFTDIKMSVMDGLQLAEEVQLHFPSVMTVFMSAYAKFDYAHKAIQLQPVDYLLKPVTSEELYHVIDRLKTKRNQYLQNMEIQYLKHQVIDYKELRSTPLPPAFLAMQWHVFLLQSGLTTSNLTEEVASDQVIWQLVDLEAMIASCIDASMKYWVIHSNRMYERWVFVASASHRQDFHSFTDTLMHRLKLHFANITLVYSPSLQLHEVRQAIEQLRKLIAMYRIFGQSNAKQVYLTEEIDFVFDHVLQFEWNDQLFEYVKLSNYDAFYRLLNEQLNRLASMQVTQYVLEHQLRKLLFTFEKFTFIPYPKLLQFNNQISSILNDSMNYQELYENLCEWFHDLLEHANSNERLHIVNKISYQDEMIDQMEQYLQVHYQEPITLSHLSKTFGFVPNYVRLLFKKHKGLTPMEYLTQLRVEQAKAIMQENPQILLKEVALLVGYQDALYFSRVFKKMTSVSPSKYLESLLT